MTTVVGIDPGKKGAFFKLSLTRFGWIYCAHAMPIITGKTHKRMEKGEDGKRRIAVNEKGKNKTRKDKDLPDWEGIRDVFHRFYNDADYYFIERVSGGQSFGRAQTGSFNFGETYGFVCGLLLGAHKNLTRVPASIWKPYFGLGNKDDKTASRKLATKLLDVNLSHPELERIRFDRIKDDGVAEAGLIGHYGYLTLKGS